MMLCSNCGNKMTINNQGSLECPICNNLKRKIEATKMTYNEFDFYKVKKTLNIITDEYLLPEDIRNLVNKGVEITVK